MSQPDLRHYYSQRPEKSARATAIPNRRPVIIQDA
jgi:hypothetical protein